LPFLFLFCSGGGFSGSDFSGSSSGSGSFSGCLISSSLSLSLNPLLNLLSETYVKMLGPRESVL